MDTQLICNSDTCENIATIKVLSGEHFCESCYKQRVEELERITKIIYRD